MHDPIVLVIAREQIIHRKILGRQKKETGRKLPGKQDLGMQFQIAADKPAACGICIPCQRYQ
jgi:hypothetical protein